MEKLHLSKPLVAHLYKNHLVLVENQGSTGLEGEESGTNSAALYKGGFEKKILWIHRESAAPFIAEDDFEMLTKILEACRLGWNDIALVNITNQPGRDEVLEELLPVCVIDSTEDKSEEWYAVTNKQNAVFLYTHPLKDIRQDKNLKIRLWNALKIIFKMN